MPRRVRLGARPNIKPGDLLMQNYPEIQHAARIERLYKYDDPVGWRWVADITYTSSDLTAFRSQLFEADLLSQVIVTYQEMDDAHREEVEHGKHQGWINQVITMVRHRKFYVRCRCILGGLEVCRDGRRITYCDTLEEARELWAWHASNPPLDTAA